MNKTNKIFFTKYQRRVPVCRLVKSLQNATENYF